MASCSSRASSAWRRAHTELVGSTIEEQTRQVLDNMEAILTEAGSGLERIVKTTVFLASLDDFQGMNSCLCGAGGRRASGALDDRGRGASRRARSSRSKPIALV